MFARKLLTGAATVAVSVTALSLSTGAAFAAATSNPQPDDTSQTAGPTSAALVGVGSDTSQHALFLLANDYNSAHATTANPMYTYAACASTDTCGTISLPTADITRPNGSGQGRATLYGGSTGTGNPDIDFARSSSAISTVEKDTYGLYMFPFALDTVVTATSGKVASYAPASLTATDVYNIYSCNTAYRNWSAFGGPNQTIDVKIPQVSSGTADFFLTQIAAQTGHDKLTSGSCWQTVQEHDPTPIMSDPNAIGPFSLGRANLATAAGNNVRVEGGFKADRALYNVVRGTDVANPVFTSVFGSAGWICTDPQAAKDIAAAGFTRLLTPSQGGVCGAPTQTATQNFTVSQVATSTGVTVTSASTPSGSAAKVIAKVSASTAPSGTVDFYEGANKVSSSVPLVSGSATATVAAAPGSHTYRAVYTPAANTAFLGSEGTGTGTVSAATTTSPAGKVASSVKAKGVKTVVGKPAKVSVKVSLKGSSSKATGKVTAKIGKKTVGTGKLKNGKATVTLKKFTKPGKYKVTLTWGGDANGESGKTSTTVVVVKK